MRALPSFFRYAGLGSLGLLPACQQHSPTPTPDASLLVGSWTSQQETRTVYNSQGQVTATRPWGPPPSAHYLRFTPTTVVDSTAPNLILTIPPPVGAYPYTLQGITFTTPAVPTGTTTYTIKALTAHALQIQASTSSGNTLARIETEGSYLK